MLPAINLIGLEPWKLQRFPSHRTRKSYFLRNVTYWQTQVSKSRNFLAFRFDIYFYSTASIFGILTLSMYYFTRSFDDLWWLESRIYLLDFPYNYFHKFEIPAFFFSSNKVEKIFLHRGLNPGLLGESQVS